MAKYHYNAQHRDWPRAAQLLCALFAALLLSGCWGEPDTGPVEIKYGRDSCDFCRMIISDPRYAAQIRGGPRHKAYKFDDIGDAMHFLKMQDWKDDPKLEIWVMDVDAGKTWLDARKANYVQGMKSPMNYGFGAVAEARDGTISYEEMRKTVLNSVATSRCLPTKNQSGDDT